MKTSSLLFLLIIISEVALAQRRPYNSPIILEERDFLLPSMRPVFISGYKFRIDTIALSKLAMITSGGLYISATITHSFIAPPKLRQAVTIANRNHRKQLLESKAITI